MPAAAGRLRGPPCGGVAFWQFNEPWLAVTWSVIDRLGRPKAAYEMLQSSYAPASWSRLAFRAVCTAGDTFEAEIWLVNDTPELRSLTDVIAQLDASKSGRAAPAVSARVRGRGWIGERPLDAPPGALTLTCEAGGAAVARNRYDLGVYLSAVAAARPPPEPRRISDRLLEIG